MLVADENANPYFKELCDAAKEIAELKAQISRLEKVIDGVLAQHLAGQEPNQVATTAPDALIHVADLEADHSEFDSDDFDSDDHGEEVIDPDAKISLTEERDPQSDHDVVADIAGNQEPDLKSEDVADHEALAASEDNVDTSPRRGSLPRALRSLICRPLKSTSSAPDDLTLIKGIDCATALELAAHGLSGFQNIADLDAERIEDLRTTVTGVDRLHKEVWIEQAAVLAKGHLTAFARETRKNRDIKDTTFTLKPDLIPLESASEDTAPDFTASEIIVDEKLIFEGLAIDKAAATLNNLAMRDLPREMHIERSLDDIVHRDVTTSFLPMGAVDAGFAVEKIAHIAPRPAKDFGNMRALAASLAAAAVIYIASATSGIVKFDTNIVQLMQQTDVCALTTWSSYPDACKQIFGNVL